MNIRVDSEGGFILCDVYNGIGIETDQGLFGIAQRDSGIEVMLNGTLVWSSSGPLDDPAGRHATGLRVDARPNPDALEDF